MSWRPEDSLGVPLSVGEPSCIATQTAWRFALRPGWTLWYQRESKEVRHAVET